MMAGQEHNSQAALRRVWADIRPVRARGLLALLLGALTMICAIGLLATSGWLISKAALQPPILALGIAVVAVRAFGLGRGVFRYTERLVSHSAALMGLTTLRTKLVARLAVVAPAGAPRLRRGDALRRLVDDVDTTAEYGLRVLLPRSTAMTVGALVVILMFWLLPMGGVFLLIGLLVAGIFSPLLTARVGRTAAEVEVGLKGELAAALMTDLRVSADVVAAGAQNANRTRISDLDAAISRTEQHAARGLGLAAALTTAVQGIALVAVVLVAVPAVRAGGLSGVNLAVVVLLPLISFEIVQALPTAAISLVRARASADRVIELLDTVDPVPDPVESASLSALPNALTAHNLRVTWPGTDAPAVTDFNLDLSPGRRIALVGPSGSGKSTIAAALVKFLPHEGDIELGEVNVDELTGDDIRRRVCLLAQDSHIFDNTVAANVRLAVPTATDEQVMEALNRAELGTWVDSLPRGLDTSVGEHGAQLSGGQRQRLALARVLLADPQIAIFDEPTEHLDLQTADQLMTDILAVRAGGATLVITHTLAGLGDVDEVIVLDAGRVIERGTPAQLAATGGWYATGLHREAAEVVPSEVPPGG
ncbi:MAG: thiol reductant ABC exporter subunit CydC [Candidatus Nanopelagicales bacterium]